jgi:hypothetical protein
VSDCFEVVVGPGGIRTRRYRTGTFGPVPRVIQRPEEDDEPGVYQRMSKGALARLRFACCNLPIELLGERWLWITLTAPYEWRRWCGTDRQTKAAFALFRQRVWREWGPLVGVWVLEFQERGAPHFHLLVGCPESVAEKDYLGLVDRQVALESLKTAPLFYRGRPFRPTIGRQVVGPLQGRDFGGEFAETIRRHWSQAVTGGTVGEHLARGVDIDTPRHGRGSEIDARNLMAYLGTEIGKASQKQAPSGYGTIRRWWDLWGRDRGFRPLGIRVVVPAEVGEAVTEAIQAWVVDRMAARFAAAGAEVVRRPVWREGVGATGIGLHGEELLGLVERACSGLPGGEVRKLCRAVEEAPALRSRPIQERTRHNRDAAGVEANFWGESQE